MSSRKQRLAGIYWQLTQVGSSGQLKGKTEEQFMAALGRLWKEVEQ